MERCPWSEGFDLYRKYHDSEWGVPLFDDRALFELLILEGAQAGLSWSTVLKKREHYRLVFNGFNPELIAHYNDQKVAELLADPGIIRNRAKVAATIQNAKAFLTIKGKPPANSGCFLIQAEISGSQRCGSNSPIRLLG